MIANLFKKYSEKSKRKKIIISIIKNLNINETQKSLYLDTIDYLDENGLNKLYKSLEFFMSEVEQKELKDITKNNFSTIAWMRKKEALEKQKDINSFSFLLNNL